MIFFQGIEALEYYLEPGSAEGAGSTTETAGELPPVAVKPPSSVPSPAGAGDQPKVFCQKGKCYPYDPARLRKQGLALEERPGMILTAAEEPSKQAGGGRQDQHRTTQEQNRKAANKQTAAKEKGHF